MKSSTSDLVNVVVVLEARRIKGFGPLGCKAAGYPRKPAWGNKRSHTDSISPSLAADGAMLSYSLSHPAMVIMSLKLLL